ncbi:MAG: Gfo/Idh/MocA family protein [Spirochaetales bacterium]
MKPVRIGVIGLGNMGSGHARDCSESELVELVAVCDIDRDKREATAEKHGVPGFDDGMEMMEQANPEAVIIATPHYDHTPLSIAALERGIHVLCEKPVGVHVNDVNKMIAAYEKAKKQEPDIKFAAMFQQRTFHSWQKIKELIDEGALGKLTRATWIITSWFRTQHYYDTGSWRATWKGEGGGVLLNQCPHNLDLYQWFFGMPATIHGTAAIGKYHHIEVEDEVTAVFEHENGMVGHFITTTAESPGTNRLEIVGELGKLVFDGGTLTFDENEQSMLEFSNTTDQGFGKVPFKTRTIEVEADQPGPHRQVTETFARSIRKGTPLVAEAPEGLGSVALANGILMSHFTKERVSLPLDGDRYESLLTELIANSTFEKKGTTTSGPADLKGSF